MISIIIPAYNAADYLAQTIESVLNQTYSDFELILIDDGSTDRTREIIKDYQCKNATGKCIFLKKKSVMIPYLRIVLANNTMRVILGVC